MPPSVPVGQPSRLNATASSAGNDSVKIDRSPLERSVSTKASKYLQHPSQAKVDFKQTGVSRGGLNKGLQKGESFNSKRNIDANGNVQQSHVRGNNDRGSGRTSGLQSSRQKQTRKIPRGPIRHQNDEGGDNSQADSEYDDQNQLTMATSDAVNTSAHDTTMTTLNNNNMGMGMNLGGYGMGMGMGGYGMGMGMGIGGYGMGMNPYSMGMGMGMGGGTGLIYNFNQYLFGFQSLIFSLGQAIQVLGMNTQAIQQLYNQAIHMLDQALLTIKELKTLEASQSSEELNEEEQMKRRRLKALRWSLMLGISYAGYSLVAKWFKKRWEYQRRRRIMGSNANASLPYNFTGHERGYNASSSGGTTAYANHGVYRQPLSSNNVHMNTNYPPSQQMYGFSPTHGSGYPYNSGYL